MNYTLKENIDTFLGLCDSMDNALNLTEKLKDIPLRDVAKMCFLNFLMYLSASDGRVKQSEADFLGDYLDFSGLTPEFLVNSIRNNNLYSTEFENEVPISLTVIVKVDNILYSKDPDVFDQSIPNIMLKIFKDLGKEFIKCDGVISESEETDLDIYLGTLREYVNRNSDRPLLTFKINIEY